MGLPCLHLHQLCLQHLLQHLLGSLIISFGLHRADIDLLQQIQDLFLQVLLMGLVNVLLLKQLLLAKHLYLDILQLQVLKQNIQMHQLPILLHNEHLYQALLLLNVIAVSLLTGSSFFLCVLLVMHAPYKLALAIFSLINVSSYCWVPFDAIKCFVVSGMSLQS